MIRRALRQASIDTAALLLGVLSIAALAWADPPDAASNASAALASPDTELPAVSARPPLGPPPSVLFYPGFAREASLRGAWVNAIERERAYDYLEAARIFESLIGKAPEEPHTYWRIARDYAWLAELAPPSDAETRARYGNLAMAWADRGLQIDPRCGECCFYKYAGMGRVAIAHGILSSLGWLKQIAQTLDHCMQIPPRFVHEPWNPELGNFYYAAASFYRLLPDSRMLEISTGIRGDPHRSLDLSRRAVALVDSAHRLQRRAGGVSDLCAVTRTIARIS